MTSNNQVHSIHNGTMFARTDVKNGIFVYSTNNGLIYAISYNSLSERQKSKLVSNEENVLTEIIDNYELDSAQLLPQEEDWALPYQLEYPLVINWLITNKCTQNCIYCYATDVIHKEKFDQLIDYKSTTENILRLNPLCVVLSGGEPFSQPDLRHILSLLSGKVGIIIDSNGVQFEEIRALAPILAEYNVVIRISIDTFIMKNASILRPSYMKRTIYDDYTNLVETIEVLRSYNLRYTVQTVLTRMNSNDLVSMGDHLYKLGIPVWKIIPVQEASGKEKCIHKLRLEDDKAQYFIDLLKKKSTTNWAGMTVVNTRVKHPLNDVILVLPDGKFYTESGYRSGKKLIADSCYEAPSMAEITDKVDLRSHFRRYLNSDI